MKRTLTPIGILAILITVSLWVYQYDRGVRYAIYVDALDVLHSDYAQLKERGSYDVRSNGYGETQIRSYTNCFVVGGLNYQCVLAADVPRFVDRGFFAITTNNTFLWVDRVAGPIPLVSSGFPPPMPSNL